MKQMTIRRAAPQDLPQLLRMVQGLAAHHGDPPLATLAHLQRDLLGECPWAIALVATAPEGLVGYAVLTRQIQVQKGLRGMDMHHLFVADAMRGQGVGRALVEGAKRTARDMGCAAITVGTHPDNAGAAAFYRAAGFETLPPPGPRFVAWF